MNIVTILYRIMIHEGIGTSASQYIGQNPHISIAASIQVIPLLYSLTDLISPVLVSPINRSPSYYNPSSSSARRTAILMQSSQDVNI